MRGPGRTCWFLLRRRRGLVCLAWRLGSAAYTVLMRGGVRYFGIGESCIALLAIPTTYIACD
jgi:hypothetical protein